ncbi:MAG: radical SAM protein, partial [Eubacterium sp.]|nr:radical SAM protein [Eubacterium sp.]
MSRKAALHNLGCKVNAYELEAMQQMLEAAGYEIVPFEPGADVYVINTCTVTNIADRKSRQMLHKARKMNPDAVVVAVGCYAQVKGEELEKDDAIDLVIGSNRKNDLITEIENFRSAGQKDTDLSDLDIDKAYEELRIDHTAEHTRAFIKVQDGCNQFCSYCIIPYARGRVRSRKIPDVQAEVRRLAKAGVREIVVTGIHLCSYGKDMGEGEDLLGLLQAIHDTPGIERIRL